MTRTRRYPSFIRDYESAHEYLKRGRLKREYWRNERPVGNHTYLVAPGPDLDELRIRYYATDVVTYHRDGTTVVDTGGWHTVTTLCRIRRFTTDDVPLFFRQRNKLWYGPAIDYTPVKRIKCGYCHGVWSNPTLAFFLGREWCRCGEWVWSTETRKYTWQHGDGTVQVGGRPIYTEWDGTPTIFKGGVEVCKAS